MKPSVLSLYIARRFSATLALILFAVSVVIFIASYIDSLLHLSDEPEFGPFLGLRLALMHVPLLLDIALPFVFLFGALLGLLALSRKLELVVARASGISVWGFLRGPFSIAIILGVFATTLLNPLAIHLEAQAENIEAELSDKVTAGGHWFRQEGGGGSSIVFAGSSNPASLTLFGITAFVFDASGHFKEKVTAPAAAYDSNRWKMKDATVFSASHAPQTIPDYVLPTELSGDELRRNLVQLETVSFWQLPGVIASAKRMGLNPDRFRVEFHSLISRPIFFLAMVMIAATVSVRFSRSGGTWRLVLTGATIGFLLYAFSEIAGDIGGNGLIDPVLAAWLPPLVALTFGATALLYQEDG